MREFIVQIQHKSNKVRDGIWYDLDRVRSLGSARGRARKFSQAYGRLSRIVEMVEVEIVEPSDDALEDALVG